VLRSQQRRLTAGPDTTLRFPMVDGTGDILVGLLNRPANPGVCPLAVLIHGLTGCAESHYMFATAASLLARDMPVLRLSLRGAGASRSQCQQQYHAGRTEDLRAVIAQLPADLTRNGVVLVGYSLGANMLLKLLGEGTPAGVRAAVSVSAPIDLAETSRRMMSPRNFFYHRWIVARMKEEALGMPISPETRAIIQGVRTCYQFDDRFVAPRNGWASADEYYAVNSAVGFLDRIAVPTLVIHALDDPWIPATAYLSFDWRSNPYLTPLLPGRGGHVGFHGTGAEPWHDQCAARFFQSY
jgi:predicted alpha/beta-fold hydrolase